MPPSYLPLPPPPQYCPLTAAALKLRPHDVALEMHSIFLMPIVYASEAEIQAARSMLVDQIQRAIENNTEGRMLDKINKFSLPSVFYLVYQGRNDKPIMEVRSTILLLYCCCTAAVLYCCTVLLYCTAVLYCCTAAVLYYCTGLLLINHCYAVCTLLLLLLLLL
jgi:hypothetical protein